LLEGPIIFITNPFSNTKEATLLYITESTVLQFQLILFLT
jgi:hypothetical protein